MHLCKWFTRSMRPLILTLFILTLFTSPAAARQADWDVEGDHGPATTQTWTVTQGTWMSLDVSPDGRGIVFDLLGDLYSMPVTGGEARRITTGPAWDMQPRYSPDGAWIAYTSDRGGADNIWLVRPDGSEAKQVTEESWRLVNSPAWSPDGDWIAAKKHFTSGRSLGAGEIWLYHRSGEGSGVQLTRRRTQQKDAGEPVYSPDGRYLYWSEDTTPGDTFEYNKDPNTQIYVVRRIRLADGKIDDLITGPGGAVRPVPSPDGRTIAFVRRVRYKTVLHLYDVESGSVRALWDGLDRDLQETWAVHGVYPAFDWSPDGTTIYIWAQGQIHRIDTATGRARPLPFRAEVSQRIEEAVRFSPEVAPDSFGVRMLRWVSVSPDGKRVVYSALGRIWIKDLPGGEPRRLTDSEMLEYYPAWSPDSGSIAYVTWDDQTLGAVWVAPVGSGSPRKITQTAGHYVEPVFTPDGGSLLYRRVGGGGLVSPLWSSDTGLWLHPIGGPGIGAGGAPPAQRRMTPPQGREPPTQGMVLRGAQLPSPVAGAVKISDSGSGAHFVSGESDRVYLMDSEGGSRALVSIGLDGKDRRVHVTSENAVSLQVSPDGRWIAYSERFKVWIVAFPRTGIPFSIGPAGGAVPSHQVSRDAGFNVHWSGDSTRLHWSLGPDLFTRPLTDTFAFLSGSSTSLPPPTAEGIPVGFETQSDRPSGILALTGARIITMDGEEVISSGTIVIEGNRITQVGPAGSIAIPQGARSMDMAGKTIMPGLVDVHAHNGAASSGIVPEQNWGHFANLAFGVTTMHDPSNDTESVFAAAEMQRAGLITAPRQFSTGTILYGAEGDIKAIIDDLDDARSHLRRMKAVGAFSVKSYNQPRREQRQQVIQAARELEMMVVPEGGSLYMHNMTMVLDGHTGIEHAIPVARMYEDALTLLARSRTGYTPTLVVAYGGLWGENYWYQHTNVWEDERLMTFTPREVVDPRSRRRTMAPEEEFNHIDVARGAAALKQRGGMVQLGAHGQMQGLGAHWELWSFVQGGMTPHQALDTATRGGAEYIGLDGQLGSLKPGMLADLVVLDADPLQDIRNSTSISFVMVNGRLFDARTMDRIAPDPARREPFWFGSGR